MDELTILYRALYQTYELIEKEEKINEKFIKEYGREDDIALRRIERYNEEEKYLHDRIVELENKKITLTSR
ncbi:hypothetical protein MKC79_09815 [[Clostridium] innocuum]|nr:hypothetical protein [[Clostridium] innocuum]